MRRVLRWWVWEKTGSRRNRNRWAIFECWFVVLVMSFGAAIAVVRLAGAMGCDGCRGVGQSSRLGQSRFWRLHPLAGVTPS